MSQQRVRAGGLHQRPPESPARLHRQAAGSRHRRRPRCAGAVPCPVAVRKQLAVCKQQNGAWAACWGVQGRAPRTRAAPPAAQTRHQTSWRAAGPPGGAAAAQSTQSTRHRQQQPTACGKHVSHKRGRALREPAWSGMKLLLATKEGPARGSKMCNLVCQAKQSVQPCAKGQSGKAF